MQNQVIVYDITNERVIWKHTGDATHIYMKKIFTDPNSGSFIIQYNDRSAKLHHVFEGANIVFDRDIPSKGEIHLLKHDKMYTIEGDTLSVINVWNELEEEKTPYVLNIKGLKAKGNDVFVLCEGFKEYLHDNKLGKQPSDGAIMSNLIIEYKDINNPGFIENAWEIYQDVYPEDNSEFEDVGKIYYYENGNYFRTNIDRTRLFSFDGREITELSDPRYRFSSGGFMTSLNNTYFVVLRYLSKYNSDNFSQYMFEYDENLESKVNTDKSDDFDFMVDYLCKNYKPQNPNVSCLLPILYKLLKERRTIQLSNYLSDQFFSNLLLEFQINSPSALMIKLTAEFMALALSDPYYQNLTKKGDVSQRYNRINRRFGPFIETVDQLWGLMSTAICDDPKPMTYTHERAIVALSLLTEYISDDINTLILFTKYSQFCGKPENSEVTNSIVRKQKLALSVFEPNEIEYVTAVEILLMFYRNTVNTDAHEQINRIIEYQLKHGGIEAAKIISDLISVHFNVNAYMIYDAIVSNQFSTGLENKIKKEIQMMVPLPEKFLFLDDVILKARKMSIINKDIAKVTQEISIIEAAIEGIQIRKLQANTIPESM